MDTKKYAHAEDMRTLSVEEIEGTAGAYGSLTFFSLQQYLSAYTRADEISWNVMQQRSQTTNSMIGKI